jgi:hypothetical protein
MVSGISSVGGSRRAGGVGRGKQEMSTQAPGRSQNHVDFLIGFSAKVGGGGWQIGGKSSTPRRVDVCIDQLIL